MDTNLVVVKNKTFKSSRFSTTFYTLDCSFEYVEECVAKKGSNNIIKMIINRYLIDGLSGMALGLFSTLIVGLILKQIGSLSGVEMITWFGNMASVLTGVGIGVGVAYKFKASPLVMFSSAVTGFIGAYAMSIISGAAFSGGAVVLSGPGEPLGAYVAAVVGIELASIISGKTSLDIVITPIFTILTGGFVGLFVGPKISTFMAWIGDIIMFATEQAPVIMGVIVSTIMGMMLTLPISSAALAIILKLNGIAAGAATVGCSTQMVGFAVMSFRENKLGGLLSQGLGTSMLQIPNIIKNPLIWIPPIIASAILGPVSTYVLGMENNSYGAGMGTSGLVGQFMTYQTMIETTSKVFVITEIIVMHFLLPAVLTLAIAEFMRKKNWIKSGDLKLEL